MAAPVSHWLRLFDFSSETTERNSTKVDRNPDLNILYQVCVIFGQSLNKNGHPGWSFKKVAHCIQVHVMWSFGPLVSIFHLTHAIYRILAAFSLKTQDIICLLSPVILANFDHDNLVLRIEKSLFSPPGSNVSRFGPCLLLDKDLHFQFLDFLK